MSDEEQSWQRLLDGVRDGDDQACHQFWNEYGPMIQRVAQRHLAGPLRRRVGPESVMLSACRTFFRRAQGGEFHLPDAESLWRLLCAITVNKVRQQARYHLRQKRGIDQEYHAQNNEERLPRAADEPIDRGPSPADVVAFDEQLQKLISTLDEEERQVLDLKLQQHTNDEIARQLSCSERTIRRMMTRIRAHLSRLIEST